MALPRTTIHFETTYFPKLGERPPLGGQNLTVTSLGYLENPSHPVELIVGSGKAELTAQDAYALIDALKMVIGRSNNRADNR